MRLEVGETKLHISNTDEDHLCMGCDRIMRGDKALIDKYDLNCLCFECLRKAYNEAYIAGYIKQGDGV